MVWPCFTIIRPCQDGTPGNSERSSKKRKAKKEMGRQHQRVDGLDFCRLTKNGGGQDEMDRAIKNQPFRMLLGSAHQMGTARMNPDPNLGVTDIDGKVHGLDNVYVVDSSVFSRCS